MDGTVLPRFKQAYITALEQRQVVCSYQSPMQPTDMVGNKGLNCWFSDDAEGTLDITLITGPTNVWVDETWNIPVRIQALGINTDDTQEILDQRACELLAECIYVLVTDPSLGIADDTQLQMFAAVPVGANTWAGGVLPPNQRAARFELSIEVKARLKLGEA